MQLLLLLPLLVLLASAEGKSLVVSLFSGSQCSLSEIQRAMVFPYGTCTVSGGSSYQLNGPTKFSSHPSPNTAYYTLDMYANSNCQGSPSPNIFFSQSCNIFTSPNTYSTANIQDYWPAPLTNKDLVVMHYADGSCSGTVQSVEVAYGLTCAGADDRCDSRENSKSYCGSDPRVRFPDFGPTGAPITAPYSSSQVFTSPAPDDALYMITVGTRAAVLLVGDHMSIEMWRVNRSVATSSLASPNKFYRDSFCSKYQNKAFQVGSIELLREEDWLVWGRELICLRGVCTLVYTQKSVDISFIYSKLNLQSQVCSLPNAEFTDTAELSAILWIGDQMQALQLWSEMEQAARTYHNAEYCGAVPRGQCNLQRAARWPNSKYPTNLDTLNFGAREIFVTTNYSEAEWSNSNTFARTIIRGQKFGATFDSDEKGLFPFVNFPGNRYPTAVPDRWCGNVAGPPGVRTTYIPCPESKEVVLPYLKISPQTYKRSNYTLQDEAKMVLALSKYCNISTQRVLVNRMNVTVPTYRVSVTDSVQDAGATWIHLLNATISQNASTLVDYGLPRLSIVGYGTTQLQVNSNNGVILFTPVLLLGFVLLLI